MKRTFYLLVCRACGDDLVMPFGSAEERGEWAGEHTRGTGHESWWVHDQVRDVAEEADLSTWLREQLAEDKRMAQTATAGPWRYNPAKEWHSPEELTKPPVMRRGEEFVGAGPSDATVGVAATGPADHLRSMADAAFIARWNPARALATCDALSDLLTELEQIHERSSDPDARNHASAGMTRMALIWITGDELDTKWLAWKAAQELLTAADPEPPIGAEVTDYLGRPWSREPEGYWLRTDHPEGDPESWPKIAGNYGPVRLTYSPAKETSVDG